MVLLSQAWQTTPVSQIWFCLFLWIKFYWNTAIFIHSLFSHVQWQSWIEMTSYNREYMVHKVIKHFLPSEVSYVSYSNIISFLLIPFFCFKIQFRIPIALMYNVSLLYSSTIVPQPFHSLWLSFWRVSVHYFLNCNFV